MRINRRRTIGIKQIRGVVVPDEAVLDLEIVAGATAKANGVPSVQEFDIACRDQRHAYVRHAIWKKPRPPAFFVENQRRRNNPLGLETAARERPLPRHDNATVRRDRASPRRACAAHPAISAAAEALPHHTLPKTADATVETATELGCPTGTTTGTPQ